VGAVGRGALFGHCWRGAVTFGLAEEILDVAHGELVMKRGVHREPTVGLAGRDEKAWWLIGSELSALEPEHAHREAVRHHGD
jgi:hypothetical protein